MKKIMIKPLNGLLKECNIDISESLPWKISIFDSEYENKIFKGNNLYDAFQKMNLFFEKAGCQILCNGARKDIVVSGMSRQMSGGRIAYIVELGKPTKKENVVDIFEYAEPNIVTTVGQQKIFYTQWVESLQNG